MSVFFAEIRVSSEFKQHFQQFDGRVSLSEPGNIGELDYRVLDSFDIVFISQDVFDYFFVSEIKCRLKALVDEGPEEIDFLYFKCVNDGLKLNRVVFLDLLAEFFAIGH